MIILAIILIIGLTYYITVWFKTQVFGYFPYAIKTDRKVIALTFDDGPNPPYTEKLLEILARHNVKATFFMPAKNLERFPDLGKEIMAAGHVIGNHSYSHKFSNNFKSLTFELEINQAQKTSEDILGKRPALYRSPWLFKQPWLLKNIKAYGFTPVAGFFGSNREIWHASAENIAKDFMKAVKPGRIMILHDGFDTKGDYRAGSVGAVDIVIPELKRQGYEFMTADELLGVPAYQNI